MWSATPWRQGLVAQPNDWVWSSCRAHLGLVSTPAWLDSDGLHAYLLGRAVTDGRSRAKAVRLYAELVNQAQAGDASFWQAALQAQMFLGDAAFVQRMQALASPQRLVEKAIPQAQRGSAPASWQQALAVCGQERNRALLWGYRQGGMTMTALARATGLSVQHVSRLIAAGERGVVKGETRVAP
jgi:putative transposase